MENDPYEIWREAMAEIESQKRLDEHEMGFQGISEEVDRCLRNGVKMDEEKEKKAGRLISIVLFLRAITIGILVVVFGALTYALIANRLNGLEFIAACSVWFGLAMLFFWGTDIAKKEQEDAEE